MKILFLSDIDSAHTIKWAEALTKRDFEIGIFSLRKSSSEWFENKKNISVFHQKGFGKSKFGGSVFSKIAYLKLLPELKKAIDSFRPDVLHAHYATSYGLLGRLSEFHPFLISVWGSDVMEFPQKSFLHRYLVKTNLKKADLVLAPSNVLVQELKKLSYKEIHVIPFGVDTKKFESVDVTRPFSDDSIIVGAIKSLENVYRIDVLIKAFAEAKRKRPELPLKLLITGTGSKENELKSLAQNLLDKNDFLFSGFIDHKNISISHNMLDVFVNVSERESFGVSVLEAMACAKPVIVSKVSGLMEVTDESCAVQVKAGDVSATAEAILSFAESKQLSEQFGDAGRKRVKENYEWNKSVHQMIKVYKKFQ